MLSSVCLCWHARLLQSPAIHTQPRTLGAAAKFKDEKFRCEPGLETGFSSRAVQVGGAVQLLHGFKATAAGGLVWV